jgi:hypothetical protein
MIGVQWTKHSLRVNFIDPKWDPHTAGSDGWTHPKHILIYTFISLPQEIFYDFFRRTLFLTTISTDASKFKFRSWIQCKNIYYYTHQKQNFHHNLLKQFLIKTNTAAILNTSKLHLFNRQKPPHYHISFFFSNFSRSCTSPSVFQCFISTIFWKFINSFTFSRIKLFCNSNDLLSFYRILIPNFL